MLPALPTVSKWLLLPVKQQEKTPELRLFPVASGCSNTLIYPELHFQLLSTFSLSATKSRQVTNLRSKYWLAASAFPQEITRSES